MKKLLLFDIDGTLLRTRGFGRATMQRVMGRLTDRAIDLSGFSFSGKTDPQIIRGLLEQNGFADADIDALLPDVLAAYVEDACARMRPGDIEVLPGAAALVDALHRRDDVTLGLVTGNMERTAFAKLINARLDAYFAFGAYGSDHADRNRLPALALSRAEVHAGRAFAGADTVIIGDTEHDIACSRSVGARCVAVCTGRFGAADLAPHEPDVLLDDLTDADRFLDAVFRD